jgi:hypothetical protein
MNRLMGKHTYALADGQTERPSGRQEGKQASRDVERLVGLKEEWQNGKMAG